MPPRPDLPERRARQAEEAVINLDDYQRDQQAAREQLAKLRQERLAREAEQAVK